jgi:iron complex outermembrane receptor protein
VSATYSFQYNHRQEFDLRRGSLVPFLLDLALMTHQFNINDLLEREKWSLETGIDALSE